MTLRTWIVALLGRRRERATIIPPEPYDEASHRLDVAVRRTQFETQGLALDGSALAERIRRNARAGRDALEGKG